MAGYGHLFYYKTFIMGNYHPLTILSYTLEYRFAGLNPLVYHLDNLLLHLLNIILIIFIVWELTAKPWPTIIAASLLPSIPCGWSQ